MQRHNTEAILAVGRVWQEEMTPIVWYRAGMRLRREDVVVETIDNPDGPLIFVRHVPTGNKIPIEWFKASSRSSRECVAHAVAAMDSLIEMEIWPDGRERERLEQAKRDLTREFSNK